MSETCISSVQKFSAVKTEVFLFSCCTSVWFLPRRDVSSSQSPVCQMHFFCSKFLQLKIGCSFYSVAAQLFDFCSGMMSPLASPRSAKSLSSVDLTHQSASSPSAQSALKSPQGTPCHTSILQKRCLPVLKHYFTLDLCCECDGFPQKQIALQAYSGL